jgi:hypothetical protein
MERIKMCLGGYVVFMEIQRGGKPCEILYYEIMMVYSLVGILTFLDGNF